MDAYLLACLGGWVEGDANLKTWTWTWNLGALHLNGCFILEKRRASKRRKKGIHTYPCFEEQASLRSTAVSTQ